MHELSITESMMQVALDQCEGRKITRITAVIGRLAGIVEDCVQFYFDEMSKGTLAEGAILELDMRTALARCNDCGREFELEELQWSCPGCGGASLELIRGKELYVDSIEVD